MSVNNMKLHTQKPHQRGQL